MVDRDDIIRMAREAGCKPFRSPEHWDDVQVFATPNVLERFAALVAAEKEKQIIDILERLQERNESHTYYKYAINVIKGEI
jgi:adenylyl- and sulfurtransferase ThiI